jgi:hypothetical protein
MRKREKIMDAAELKLSIPDTATKTIEGGIRPLARGNKLVDVPGSSDDVIAAGAASIADIEKLMAELLVARDYLQAEGERVRRINVNYAHLAQTASASVKIIAESIGKWRIPEHDAVNQASKVMGRMHQVAAMSQTRDGEHQHEPKASS